MITRRSLLLSALAVASPRARKLWPGTHLGGPDPQGRFLSIVDPSTGDLATRSLSTGVITRLTSNPPGSPEFAYFSAVSRDGGAIAYAWFNEEQFYELRVVDTAGGKPRTLQRNEERRFVQPCAWSPGNRQILTLFFRNDNISQIALVDAASGAVKVLKSLDWVYPNKMDLSPDGRWVVYDDIGKDGQTQRDIFLLAADGSSNRRLVEHNANDVFPLFAPDGKGVLFLSDRSGSTALYHQPLEGGAPRLLHDQMGRALALGITRDGNYYYALRSGQAEIHVGPPDAPRPLLSKGPAEATQPAWSVDGRAIAFLANTGHENFGQESRVIFTANVETGQYKALAAKLAHIDSVKWSPDSRSLLAAGSDRHGQRGLYLVSVENGETKPVVRERASTYHGLEGVFAADGSVVYIQNEELRWKDRALYHGASLRHLAISPDGTTLAFAEKQNEATLIKVIPLAGGEAQQLASIRQGDVSSLEWFPDGGALLASVPSNPPAAWRVPLAGPRPEKLAWSLHQQGPIRFHPNGKWVAYSSGKTQTEIWMLEKVI